MYSWVRDTNVRSNITWDNDNPKEGHDTSENVTEKKDKAWYQYERSEFDTPEFNIPKAKPAVIDSDSSEEEADVSKKKEEEKVAEEKGK